ncbi:MAG TPA: flagellar hook capping FlgD N-terminal domain-containing protein [Armatimonadota bacterium]|jgi:flagellar basal-body rod modification protein FlgD
MQVASATQTSSTQSATPTNTIVGNQDFMKLLIAQLQQQDPLDPMKPSDFMGQLAQLQTVSQLSTVGDQLSQLNAGQNRSGPLSLLGRQVAWSDDQGASHQGQVEEVRLSDSASQLVVGGQLVNWSQIQSVR